MKLRKKGTSKYFAYFVLVVMIASLSAGLLSINAGAIAPDMTASNPGVVNNSNLPDYDDMDPGQIATAKNVADNGSGAQGQFSVTYSAIGREMGYEGPQIAALLSIQSFSLIADAGIRFTDTFNDEYDFVFTSDTEMKIKVDGNDETAVAGSDGIYVFQMYDGPEELANRIRVEINPNRTVVYTIGANCLNLIPAWAYDEEGKYINSNEVEIFPNSLAFDVRLRDTVNTQGTYKTNEKDSCKVEFNALQSNNYYYQERDEYTYSNVKRTPTTAYLAAQFNPPWNISDLDFLRIYLVYDPLSNQYYHFNKSDGHVGIAPSTRVGEETNKDHFWYDLWVDSGIYTGLRPGDPLDTDIIEILSPFSFTVHFDHVAEQAFSYNYEGTINKLEPLDTPQFEVTNSPAAETDECAVRIGDITYTGVCTEWLGEFSWSFTDEGYFFTLLNQYDLKVIYQQGGWKNTTNDAYVMHLLDAYGHITLSQPNIVVVPTGSLTVTKDVISAPNVTPPANENFAITVTFTAGSYAIGGISSNPVQTRTASGNVITYNFSLIDGQSVTFSSIPETTTYTVTEDLTTLSPVNGKWSLDETSSKLAGSIAANTTTTATLVNDYAVVGGDQDKPEEPEEPEEEDTGVLEENEKLPQTGGISSSTLIGIFGLALITIGGTTFMIYKKKFLK